MTIPAPATRSPIALAFGLTLILSTSALANSVYVTANGTDSGGCGPKTDTCRSITRAITNAGIGDTILVGPGRYGDLDNDGVLGGLGEETASACDTQTCMIAVNKQVTILSTGGAFATVINPGPASVDISVGLMSNGAVFGGKGKGFHVNTPETVSSRGISVTALGITGVVVSGNLVDVGADAFAGILTGGGSSILGNRVVSDNSSSYGIGSATGDQVIGNSVSGAGLGISVNGNDEVVTGNVITGNTTGLYINGTGNTVSKCSIVANTNVGVNITGFSTGTISGCNIYGNDAFTNRGVLANGSAVSLIDNWWGAATGPGANPADEVSMPGAGMSTPFATALIKVKLKALK